MKSEFGHGVRSTSCGIFTVNWEFPRGYSFLRNFAGAEFPEHKTLAKWRKLFLLM